MMNPLKICALISVLAAAGCQLPPDPPAKEPGARAAIRHATFDRFSENDFKRISEYFTDEENKGGNLIFRTDPEKRSGAYLSIGLEWGTRVAAGSTIDFYYCVPAKTGYFHHRWKIKKTFYALPEREIMLGVTDCGDAMPNAWRFVITSAGGNTIAARSSFLWSEYNGAQNN